MTLRDRRLTEADLDCAGYPLRLRDLQTITGLSRPAILAEMDRGALVGFQIIRRPGSPWLFDREVVASWWRAKRSTFHTCKNLVEPRSH